MTVSTPQSEVRPLAPADREWVRTFLLAHNGSLRVVSRGVMHDVGGLPGFAAVAGSQPVGLLTYRLDGDQCEVVTLHATPPRHGVGTQLLEAARARAQAAGCRRLWLITTNDNAPAIRFYERRGMRFVAVHRGAVGESRKLKPEIPLTGVGGVPIEDEIEFEYALQPARP